MAGETPAFSRLSHFIAFAIPILMTSLKDKGFPERATGHHPFLFTPWRQVLLAVPHSADNNRSLLGTQYPPLFITLLIQYMERWRKKVSGTSIYPFINPPPPPHPPKKVTVWNQRNMCCVIKGWNRPYGKIMKHVIVGKYRRKRHRLKADINCCKCSINGKNTSLFCHGLIQ